MLASKGTSIISSREIWNIFTSNKETILTTSKLKEHLHSLLVVTLNIGVSLDLAKDKESINGFQSSSSKETGIFYC